MPGVPLVKIFGGMLNKQGYSVTEYRELGALSFENEYLTGMIAFDKGFKVRWKCKESVYLYDCPAAPGHTTCEFKSAKDMLDFLQRRLICKRQYN